MDKEITGYDPERIKSDTQEVSVAYYRIDPAFRDFIKLCDEKNGVVGFKYELGELNFGILVLTPKQTNG